MRFKEGSQSFHRRYAIYEPLGAGGMAAVYRAKDRLGGYVALKRLVHSSALQEMKEAASSPMETTYLVSRRRAALGAPRAALDVTMVSPSSGGGVTLEDLRAFSSIPPPLDEGGPTLAMEEGALARMSEPPQAPASVKDTLVRPVMAAEVLPAAAPDPFSDGGMQLRLALAVEFQTLSSVRHPNVISVLDYGFDEDGQPYFTMELLENAQTILEAGRHLPAERKIALLEQMLQALLYLHRRQVIHRDLKPGNVLVVDGRVKVLDFGVAVLAEQARESGRAVAGTPAYMAPELFQGKPASEASDLYAVGVIAYELFTGQVLFAAQDLWVTVADVLHKVPDLSGIDPRLAPVLRRLLAKDPNERYSDAAEVILALGEATGEPLRIETAATRESCLQAARLIGRDPELALLAEVLGQAMDGRGSAWLVGGESGVGKSRLLDELRARALVAGAAVLRGQEVSEGGGPYQLWGDVLRWLVLLADPRDDEASILKPFVSDIPALLGRPVYDPPEIAPEGIHTRLAVTVEELLRRLQQPALILLEDLHWSRSDSLKLLARVTSIAADLPVLFVASYRDDERGELPAMLPAMGQIKLDRLTSAGIAALAESMIGPAGARPEVIERLIMETEGNPFFLVEVVRALAERAGQLNRIGQEPLSERVSSRGVELVVGRRLRQVPRVARPQLEAAAVAGRRIDLALMHAIDSNLSVEAWLAICTAAAVIDVQDGYPRFAHDKLREGLLEELAEERRRALHRQIAEAIEHVYPDHPAHTAALAHHWAAAGEPEKAAHYSGLAGEQALHSGAYQEAVEFFEQALSFLPEEAKEAAPVPVQAPWRASMKALGKALLGARSVETRRTHLLSANLEGLLAEAHSRLGHHGEGRRHAERALAELGVPMLEGATAGLGLGAEALLLGLRSLLPSPFIETSAAAREALAQAARIQNQVTESCFYTEDAFSLFLSGLRALNLGESAGSVSELARMYNLMGVVAGLVPARAVAERLCQRGYELAESACKPHELVYVLQHNSAYQMTIAAWARAEEQLRRGIALAERSGDRRPWEESSMMLSMVCSNQGRFAEGYRIASETLVAARRRSDGQILFWGALLQTTNALRLGMAAGPELIEASLPWVEASGMAPEVLNAAGNLAHIYLLRGDRAQALAQVEKALVLISGKRPVAYWTYDAVESVAEVSILLWEGALRGPAEERARLGKLADRAWKGLATFAQIFPFARAAAWLWRGVHALVHGKAAAGRRALTQAITEAEQMGMPYVRARAHFELGRRSKGHERTRHLMRAIEFFAEVDARPELRRAEAALKQRG